jgi:hypothetical protein
LPSILLSGWSIEEFKKVAFYSISLCPFRS